jgi:anti-sigma factor RsiW
LPAFAGLAAIAAGLIVALLLLPAQRQSTRITAALVDAHVRSLQPGHLTDVVSSDQHTVKPWFDGKLDFIPPVSAYAAQGFPLLGGRLDVVDLHNVAALVYGRRKHVINLFIWPARDAPRLSDNSGTRQGYHWLTWQADDMQYCLVSDVAPGDLRELEELLRSSGATAIPH